MNDQTHEITISAVEDVRAYWKDKPAPRYHIVTFGCQMNVRDSEVLAGILESMGYCHTSDAVQADLIIFNTCCIRDHAEARLFGNLGALRKRKEDRRDFLIGVCGCMTQQEDMAPQIKKRFPFVDFVLGTNHPQKLPTVIRDVLLDKTKRVVPPVTGLLPEEGLPSHRSAPPCAYVSIMYGCDNYCSYCIVPYVRGREHSRGSAHILSEITQLGHDGYREVTLLGQNVNSYRGSHGESFADLLRGIERIEGIERVRFMTSHPKDLSDDLIEAMAQSSKVCRHLHLPVRSGSSSVLARMNRRYTREDYLRLVEKLRKRIPGVTLTTDFIVGFPEETEEDYTQTLSLVDEVDFAAAYMFAFSRRPGTAAYTMEGQLDPQLIHDRLLRLIERQNTHTLAYHRSLLDTRQQVLVEGPAPRGQGQVQGRIDSGRTVTLLGQTDWIGQMIPVRIVKATLNALVAKTEHI